MHNIQMPTSGAHADFPPHHQKPSQSRLKPCQLSHRESQVVIARPVRRLVVAIRNPLSLRGGPTGRRGNPYPCVILSESNESKDLGTVDPAKIPPRGFALTSFLGTDPSASRVRASLSMTKFGSICLVLPPFCDIMEASQIRRRKSWNFK